MQLPAWALRHPWILAAGACLVLGGAAGWLTADLPAPAARLADRAVWRVPGKDELSRYDAGRFQALLRSAAWAQARQLGNGGRRGRGGAGGRDPDQPWTLVGIVAAPSAFALILPKGRHEPLRLTPGASLPDGGTIERIDKDVIEVSSGGCVLRLPLYPAAARSADAACTPAAGTGMPAGVVTGETTHD